VGTKEKEWVAEERWRGQGGHWLLPALTAGRTAAPAHEHLELFLLACRGDSSL
jgi:hypothetical protein